MAWVQDEYTSSAVIKLGERALLHYPMRHTKGNQNSGRRKEGRKREIKQPLNILRGGLMCVRERHRQKESERERERELHAVPVSVK